MLKREEGYNATHAFISAARCLLEVRSKALEANGSTFYILRCRVVLGPLASIKRTVFSQSRVDVPEQKIAFLRERVSNSCSRPSGYALLRFGSPRQASAHHSVPGCVQTAHFSNSP